MFLAFSSINNNRGLRGGNNKIVAFSHFAFCIPHFEANLNFSNVLPHDRKPSANSPDTDTSSTRLHTVSVTLIMDIVLEIFDTFLFDRLYAICLPAALRSYGHDAMKDATSTFSSMREMPTAPHPSNQFFQLKPSQYAYMSAWSRENPWRQGLSLYLITW